MRKLNVRLMKVRLHSILFFFASVCSFQLAYAQSDSGVIRGTVMDNNNQPIPFASVVVKGTNIGTTANGDGSYRLGNLPKGNVSIRASFIGYTIQDKDITLDPGSDQSLDFELKESSSLLDEVIVSAGRRVESLAETPSSVTVVNAKEIGALSTISPNIANILAFSVPGLGASTNQTGNSGQTLRGRNLLVLIDGIPQSTPLRAGGRDIRSIDPSVIERVEVIKGATAIYGNGADGGLMNYITKTPKTDRKIGGYSQLSLTGNTRGDSTLGFRASQQLYGRVAKFDYVVSGMYEKTGVYRDPKGLVISPDYGLGETKIYNAFAKVGYNFNASERIEAMYNYYSSNQHSAYVAKAGVYGESPAIGVWGTRKGIDEGTRYNHNANIQYTNKNIIGRTSLTANVYLQDFWTVYSNSESFFGSGQSAIISTKKGFRLNLNTPFTISSKLSGDVTYGVDILNDKTEQNLVDGRSWVPRINMNNLAPYAQLTTQWFDYLNLKTGLRAENIKMDIADYATLATGPDGAGSINVTGGKLDYNAFVFNAGLRYSKYKRFNPFVSYSQSFSIFDLGRILRAANENTVAGLQTEPIIVNNYEVGFSSALGPLNVSAAYYYSTSKLGSNLLLVDGKYVAERLPERVWGYEFQVDYQVTNNFVLGGNYAFVEGKGDKDGDGNFNGPTDKYLNSNRITPVKIATYARYNKARFNADLNWLYVGKRDRFAPNEKGVYPIGEGPIESYNTFNLSLGYKITESLKADLGIENLLNTVYYPAIAQFYGTAIDYRRGNGRRFNLTVGYRF